MARQHMMGGSVWQSTVITLEPGSDREIKRKELGFHCTSKGISPMTRKPPMRSHLLRVSITF